MSNLVYLDGELWHADDIPDDVLIHYGVKGMKWGQRRNSRKMAKLESKIERRYASARASKNPHIRNIKQMSTVYANTELARRQLKDKKYKGKTLTKREQKLYRSLTLNRRLDQVNAAVGNTQLAVGATALALSNKRVRGFVVRNGKRVYNATRRPRNSGALAISR